MTLILWMWGDAGVRAAHALGFDCDPGVILRFTDARVFATHCKILQAKKANLETGAGAESK